MRRIVVAGASRGIGAAVAAHYAGQGDHIIALSRGQPALGHWLPCDLSDPAQISAVPRGIGTPIDAVLFTGGVWENDALTDAYRFATSPADKAANVLAVNLLAPILLVQALLPLKHPGARVVLVGSTSGLDNAATPEVANTASKFGLRGAAQALALTLHPRGVGISVINRGNVATPEVELDISEGRFPAHTPIPMVDLMQAFDFALSLSPASAAREITLGQIFGG